MWVRIPPGAHNSEVSKYSLKTAVALAGAFSLLLFTVSGCSAQTGPEDVVIPSAGNQFESDNPTDSTFTDDAGNEMQVGQNLDLPSDWPADIPTPAGRLVAVSIVNESTAVATWQIDGDIIEAEINYLKALESRGFQTSKSDDLSTDSISVFFAINSDFDITVSATPGEQESDPGEITVLVNPAP